MRIRRIQLVCVAKVFDTVDDGINGTATRRDAVKIDEIIFNYCIHITHTKVWERIGK